MCYETEEAHHQPDTDRAAPNAKKITAAFRHTFSMVCFQYTIKKSLKFGHPISVSYYHKNIFFLNNVIFFKIVCSFLK